MEGELPDIARPDDGDGGTRPAILFAIVLGAIVGGTAIAVFAGGSALIGALGGLGTGTAGLIASAAAWLAFWIGLSLGISAGLVVGYHVWTRLAPPRRRRKEAAVQGAPQRAVEDAIREEQAAAVREAESLLHRPHRTDRER